MTAIPLPWSSPLWEGVLGIAYIALALSVSVDVLLKKSDVRAALGWIAAAWLSPVLGSLLYYMFGINRVTRRALKLGRPDSPIPSALPKHSAVVRDQPMKLLDHCSQTITGTVLSDNNAVQVLTGGDEAYPAMLAAIAAAQGSVALASYIFRNDKTGNAFADALIAAHRRGVEVRVLLDSVGIGYFYPRIYHRIRQAGVPADRFLHTWVPYRMPFLNMRNHRKLLLVDGHIAFMGGINIGDEYSKSHAAAAHKPYVTDIHFRVEGPAVAHLMDAFARDWEFTTTEELRAPCWWPELKAAGEVSARVVQSGPDNDLYKIESMIGAALCLARQRVRVVTPYFLPDQRLQFAIAQAVLRGVVVDIVVPQQSDWRIMDWALRGHLRFFRHIPANFHAVPPPFDHAKLVVVDDEWCLIGSSNWDARSLRLNFEIDLECYDKALAAKLNAAIDARMARAQPLSGDALAHQPVLLRLRNAAARLAMPYL